MSTQPVSTKLARIATGEQRIMRLSGVLLRSPAKKQVLTNRMREIFTYGSVGGAEGNPGSYPAANAGNVFGFVAEPLVVGHVCPAWLSSFEHMITRRILPLLLLAVLTASCSTKPKHVGAAEFQREWQMRHTQTVHWCSFLGETNGNVFMLRKTMPLVGSKWKEEVLFTGTNGLPADFVGQMRAVSKLEQDSAGNSHRAGQ